MRTPDPKFAKVTDDLCRDLYVDAGGTCRCGLQQHGHSVPCSRPLNLGDYGTEWQVLDLAPELEHRRVDYVVLCAECARHWVTMGAAEVRDEDEELSS